MWRRELLILVVGGLWTCSPSLADPPEEGPPLRRPLPIEHSDVERPSRDQRTRESLRARGVGRLSRDQHMRESLREYFEGPEGIIYPNLAKLADVIPEAFPFIFEPRGNSLAPEVTLSQLERIAGTAFLFQDVAGLTDQQKEDLKAAMLSRQLRQVVSP